MKRSTRRNASISIALIIATVLSCTLLVVFAHSGRTDGNGGHYNRSTGEYHYHHGYSAHQHYDMDGDGDRDCPYKFKDATNHSSGGGGTSSSNKPMSSSKGNVSTNINKEDKELRAFWWITIILAIVAFIAIITIKRSADSTISSLNAKISNKDNEIKTLKDKIETTKKEYADVIQYANKSIYELTSIPTDIKIASDGTPIIQDVYTASYRPKTFHCMPGCRGNILYRHSFYEVAHLDPCHFCTPTALKSFKRWFPDYAEKLLLLAKYNVPIKEHIEYASLSNVVKNYKKYVKKYPYISLNQFYR